MPANLPIDLADAKRGMAWFNNMTEARRLEALRAADATAAHLFQLQRCSSMIVG